MSSLSQGNRERGNEDETRSHADLENLPIPICHLLADGTLSFANQAFCAHFNDEAQNLLGSNFLDLFQQEPRSALESIFISLTPANPFLSSLVSYKTSDQKTHWERWTLQGTFDPEGQLAKIEALGYDLDVRGLSVSTASQYAQQLSALQIATQLLLSNLDLESLLGQILDATVSAIPGAVRSVLYLVTSSTGNLEIQNVLDCLKADPRIRRFNYPGDSGYITRILRNRVPLRIDALQTAQTPSEGQEIEPARDLLNEPSASAIAAPLILGVQLLGAISIESTQESAFTNADLHLLQNFAVLTTLAINNSQLQAELQRMEILDPLTKIYNRRGIYDLGEREFQRALRFDRPLSVMLVDIDDFKQVNAKHGLKAGDKILQFVGEQIQNNVRKVDIIGRYGDDEFILLLPETDLFGASAVADRVRSHITQTPVQYEGTQFQITVCLGIVKLIAKQENMDNLIRRAEEALQLAKKSGKNRVEIR
jgi:diguanylate cyclase (GGDEF)-like protein